MLVNKEQLKALQEILLQEYGSTLAEESLLNEALKLSEFAKTVLKFKLNQNGRIRKFHFKSSG